MKGEIFMAKYPVNQYLSNRYLTADELEALSSKDVYSYCFIDGKKSEWSQDYYSEICDNIDRYDSMQTLSGEPLGYIKTRIYINMSKWIPEGKKLNPKLIYTLQTILERNKAQLRNLALTGKANVYLSKCCSNLTELINKAFEDELSNNIDN